MVVLKKCYKLLVMSYELLGYWSSVADSIDRISVDKKKDRSAFLLVHWAPVVDH